MLNENGFKKRFFNEEDIMDTKTLLENVRKEVQSALSKTFDRVEEFSKHQRLRLKISSIKGDIKDVKAHVGDYIYQHRDEYAEYPVLEQNIKRIENLYKSIDELNKEIEALKEQDDEDIADNEKPSE